MDTERVIIAFDMLLGAIVRIECMTHDEIFQMERRINEAGLSNKEEAAVKHLLFGTALA